MAEGSPKENMLLTGVWDCRSKLHGLSEMARQYTIRLFISPTVSWRTEQVRSVSRVIGQIQDAPSSFGATRCEMMSHREDEFLIVVLIDCALQFSTLLEIMN